MYFLTSSTCAVFGQGKDTTNLWYAEMHIAAIGSFGPTETQAEIAGGVGPSYSYDGKQHLSPGFKTSTAFDLAGGFRRNIFLFEGTLSSFSQELGLVETPVASSNGPKLGTANMMSLRLSFMMPFFDLTKRPGFYGLNWGFFISGTSALSSQITEEAKLTYGIAGISTAVQFNWGSDFKYAVRLGHQGLYAVAMMSLTFPGAAGSIGKLEMQSGASYTMVREDIKMYSVKASIGIGYRFANKANTKH